MKTTLFTFVAAAFCLTACTNEDSMSDGWDGRLHLSSSIVQQTRATFDLDVKINENEKVWLYIDGTGTGTPNYYAETLTATSSNGFTVADSKDLFFPANEESINLYAFHINPTGSLTTMPNDYPTSQLTHKVEQDQSTIANYAKSDLLYSKETKTKQDVKAASGTVTLTFKHLLSKIEVVLKKGKGGDDITISKVEILNTKLEATFTPAKATAIGDVTVGTNSSETISDANPIEIGHEFTSGSGDVLNEAIIVPQTLASGTAFIRITLQNGGVLTYSLGAGTTFATNMKYKYTITANLTDLNVESEITPWDSGTNVDNGVAEM